ncbi:myb/SANT-like DNA-binding domain-containing protein 3 isoform X2 [Spea bombifrons]|uniref:myb/SANT-like DNA-binding domain-containing protein 3 isoform X2 n=1 Tax=Spea bombifrons TaxID=233779 RepID=UPI00234A5982|nr:myb/SANT-like DNA-binding domain-containing protein 3 isoform X2 [Spea bombifrons]
MQNNEVLKPAKYFSELEKSVLLALVEKYKYVLECKKSDARTIALKQRTWQALAHEYNSQPSVSLRDFKQLKKCWENIKARTKKIMAHERREKVKRCGPASNSHQALKEKVASMIPEQLYFVQNPAEEEAGYNHDTSNHVFELSEVHMNTPGSRAVGVRKQTEESDQRYEIDCKRVNLLDLELLIDEQGKIQTKPFRKVPETNSLCADGSPPRSIEKDFHKGDLELLIDEQGKIQTEPIRKVPVTDSMCAEGSSPSGLKKDTFVVPDRVDLYEEEKAMVNMHDCEGTSHAAPSCSTGRITNRTYRSKASQDGMFKKMQEEEHHQQMSMLQLQLIQMNEVHVAKVQQIERECEMAEEEHRIKMEILNKKKMYWERKLQTITKEWPVASFNRPFPNSP